MEWVYLIIAGLIIGLVARFLLPGPDPIGVIGTILVGIVGALIGGALWNALAPNNDNEGVAVIPGIIVAMILLFIYRKVAGNRSRGVV
ncbi:MAG: GlsB/YeaQ/YmgE family stress response membrane protein [Actinomycetota bacterium]|nr:GlsB/YeaQ/YmgE family stress response membrane protein [Actinomycetota bacterium]